MVAMVGVVVASAAKVVVVAMVAALTVVEGLKVDAGVEKMALATVVVVRGEEVAMEEMGAAVEAMTVVATVVLAAAVNAAAAEEVALLAGAANAVIVAMVVALSVVEGLKVDAGVEKMALATVGVVRGGEGAMEEMGAAGEAMADGERVV